MGVGSHCRRDWNAAIPKVVGGFPAAVSLALPEVLHKKSAFIRKVVWHNLT
jgi:hypothetical protein